jgi:hypothetical protein
MNRPPFLPGCMKLFDECSSARATVRVTRTEDELKGTRLTEVEKRIEGTKRDETAR